MGKIDDGRVKLINSTMKKEKVNSVSVKGRPKDRKDQDDGEYMSDSCSGKEQMPNCDIIVGQVQKRRFVTQIEVDFTAVGLLIFGLITRLWHLEEPRSIVFDELHYGKYASLYLKQTFFFDSHPPLGKQLIALAIYFAGFDGSFKFDRIGSAYSQCTPVWALRIVPALCGSLLVPTVYLTLLELGLAQWTSLLAALLVLFDNALLTQSRFALMESILLLFSVLAILCLLKFRKLPQNRAFSVKWWTWLTLTGIFFTCGTCVKYVGFFSSCLACIIICRDYWYMLADKSLTKKPLLLHFLARILTLVIIPVAIYISTFYVHLTLLNKAGPHDNVMTSAFQASLEGGLASITKGQPLEVAHGSQITLRHTFGRTCWLHSHPHVYPIRYSDQRGSSHQQQITCYSFKDINNWWIVKRPNKNDLVVSEPIDKIRHGDIIQIVHGMTSRALNSHDVAAPMTPQNQEVSCYIDYNVSMPAQNLWKVHIINRENEGDVWHTIQSRVRLIHVNSTQALKFSGRQLPDWGFHQHEVVTDRVINQDDTVWNVEEHRYTKSADQKDRERELGMAEFVPMAPTQLSFWQKLGELQLKMFTVNQENVQDHLYSSEPLEWPLLTKGIAYWVSPTSNAQVFLLGNILLWYSAAAAIFVYFALLVVYLLRRRRACYDIPEDLWLRFVASGELLLGGYLLHYIPFFAVDRTLFLHHYLPAFLFQLLLIAALVDHLHPAISLKFGAHWAMMFAAGVVMWTAAVIYVFWCFATLSYGNKNLSVEDVTRLMWKETWDLIVHKQ